MHSNRKVQNFPEAIRFPTDPYYYDIIAHNYYEIHDILHHMLKHYYRRLLNYTYKAKQLHYKKSICLGNYVTCASNCFV